MKVKKRRALEEELGPVKKKKRELESIAQRLIGMADSRKVKRLKNRKMLAK